MTGHLRCIVVGTGNQGRKRRAVAGEQVVATIDPLDPSADYRDVRDVPATSYDAALVATPNDAKLEILRHLVANGKHAMVEKPLLAPDDAELLELDAAARRTGVVIYTAYNHRFEPHLVTLRRVLQEGRLGEVYRVRLSYGNGTAADVRASLWRDAGTGVLTDLGSHLLDTMLFLFGALPEQLEVTAAHCFENRAFDHVTCRSEGPPLVELETSLVSWRNSFTAEVVGARGSATVDSLCKWGPSTLTIRDRVLPSGRPDEEETVLVQPDPTWTEEFAYFESLCAAGSEGNVANDVQINGALRALGEAAFARSSESRSHA